jgi:hypothetical protein
MQQRRLLVSDGYGRRVVEPLPLDRGGAAAAMPWMNQQSPIESSVVGRVLWGKGLINSGKAAEAMQQFDTAVNIDKENPHAYNLISEVLLRKGLYRSALPILRKASALQPNDARIKQWVEQARAALAGGPAPILYDETSVNTKALVAEPATPPLSVEAPPAADAEPTTGVVPAVSTPSGEFPNSDPDVFAAFTPAKDDPRAEPTVLMSAYTPEAPAGRSTLEMPTQTSQIPEAWPSAPRSMDHKPGPPVPTLELPAVPGSARAVEDNRPTMEIPASNVLVASLRPSHDQLPMVMGSLDDRTSTAELPLQQGYAAEAPDPFAALSKRTESTETFRGLTSTFQALEEAEPGPLPLPLPPAPPVIGWGREKGCFEFFGRDAVGGVGARGGAVGGAGARGCVCRRLRKGRAERGRVGGE